MIRARSVFLAGTVLAAAFLAQLQTSASTLASATLPAQTDSKPATLPSGIAMNAELNSSVDSRKAKVGEKVEAHTTEEVHYDGKTIIPKGAKLEGHITEATSRAKGDSGSTLAIQFDRAILKKGEEFPLHVVTMAVAAPLEDFYPDSPGPAVEPMAGQGAAAAGGSPMGAPAPQPPPTGMPPSASGGPLDSTSPPSRRTQLSASSRGVYGLKDLKLMMVSSKTSQTTVIVSSGKDVHLDSGTRLLLMARADTPTAPAAANK
jgi:hypothetical protein